MALSSPVLNQVHRYSTFATTVQQTTSQILAFNFNLATFNSGLLVEGMTSFTRCKIRKITVTLTPVNPVGGQLGTNVRDDQYGYWFMDYSQPVTAVPANYNDFLSYPWVHRWRLNRGLRISFRPRLQRRLFTPDFTQDSQAYDTAAMNTVIPGWFLTGTSYSSTLAASFITGGIKLFIPGTATEPVVFDQQIDVHWSGKGFIAA